MQKIQRNIPIPMIIIPENTIRNENKNGFWTPCIYLRLCKAEFPKYFG